MYPSGYNVKRSVNQFPQAFNRNQDKRLRLEAPIRVNASIVTAWNTKSVFLHESSLQVSVDLMESKSLHNIFDGFMKSGKLKELLTYYESGDMMSNVKQLFDELNTQGEIEMNKLSKPNNMTDVQRNKQNVAIKRNPQPWHRGGGNVVGKVMAWCGGSIVVATILMCAACLVPFLTPFTIIPCLVGVGLCLASVSTVVILVPVPVMVGGLSQYPRLKVRILGRDRLIITSGVDKFVRYNNKLLPLPQARALDKERSRRVP